MMPEDARVWGSVPRAARLRCVLNAVGVSVMEQKGAQAARHEEYCLLQLV